MFNAVNCKRNAGNNYQGDERYTPVQLGNLVATAAAFLMTVASLRGVEVVVENHLPVQSGKFPILKQGVAPLLLAAHGRQNPWVAVC